MKHFPFFFISLIIKEDANVESEIPLDEFLVSFS